MQFLPLENSDTISAALRHHSDEIIVDFVSGGGVDTLFTSLMRNCFVDALDRAGAHEGTVWLADNEKDMLVPIFNSGSTAKKFVEYVRQPIDQGIISMVYCTQESFCEFDIQKNQLHDGNTDSFMEQRTKAQIAVPLAFAGNNRGVCSAVVFEDNPTNIQRKDHSPIFDANSLFSIELVSELIGHLIDLRLVNLGLGRELQ
ncbi:MAG: hypothetical protein ACI9R3_001749 [Verrucomicrobiales bacterium]|jgi:hypothetical protein